MTTNEQLETAFPELTTIEHCPDWSELDDVIVPPLNRSKAVAYAAFYFAVFACGILVGIMARF